MGKLIDFNKKNPSKLSIQMLNKESLKAKKMMDLLMKAIKDKSNNITDRNLYLKDYNEIAQYYLKLESYKLKLRK
jgi:hypothetical protein